MKSDQGFTLLEVAIVMIIVGLLTAPLMVLYKNYMEQQYLLKTNGSLFEANNAMQRFFLRNGFYPCPSGRNLTPANATFGQCDTATLPALGACNAAGVCRVAGATAGQTVLIGALPFRDLEMQAQDTIDGYQNKIQYFITASSTAIATFNPAIREVEVVDSTGASLRLIPGALVAPGANKVGAFLFSGGLRTNCAAGTGLDVENCDLDNQVMETEFSNTDDANNYDDVLTTTDWTRGQIWEYTPTSSDDIYNRNPGNLGIGTDLPTEKLDVAGNVRVENVNAQRYCDATGTNCFSPDIIGGRAASIVPGGKALDCNTQMMTGVDAGVAKCGGVALPSLANKACVNAGEYVQGFDTAGNLICAHP